MVLGPVPVVWKRENGRGNFEITILPDIHGSRHFFPLKPGAHRGSYPSDVN